MALRRYDRDALGDVPEFGPACFWDSIGSTRDAVTNAADPDASVKLAASAE